MPKKVKKHKAKIDEKIIENLIELQKVHTDLASKFDSLSKQVSNLLNLFEMAAKSFMEQPAVKESEKDKEFLQKIDTLLDQNKTLARGLTLLEERMRERVYGTPHAQHPVQVMQPVQHIRRAVHREERKETGEETQPPAGTRPLPKF